MAHQKVLVTGADGNLGQDLMARLALFSDRYETVGTTYHVLDFSWETSKVNAVLDDIHPDVIVNTAAYTQVDAAESQPELTTQVNAGGPKLLAQWLQKNGGYMVHISTDYVFDGQKGSPYTPQDTPNPINHYGVSKLGGEKAVLETLPAAGIVLRTSWLFGAAAQNFVPFLIRSAQSQTPIRVVYDQVGTPTWTGNLCKMILKVLEDRPVGILHGCSSGYTSRYDQAQYVCQCLGVASKFITPVTTESFKFTAQRPMNTAMISSFEDAPSWQEATVKFLETQGLFKSYV